MRDRRRVVSLFVASLALPWLALGKYEPMFPDLLQKDKTHTAIQRGVHDATLGRSLAPVRKSWTILPVGVGLTS